MKKKQEVSFRGVTKFGQVFFTPHFESCVLNSKINPVPMNRKSRKAMFKLIQGMENDQEQTNPEADKIKKEKRKAKRKSVRVSRRLNRAISRAA